MQSDENNPSPLLTFRFLEFLTQLPEVYVVTMQEALEYVKNPVPLSEIDSFEPFQCNHLPKPDGCVGTENCRLDYFLNVLKVFFSIKNTIGSSTTTKKTRKKT
jgi:hypothetical protein